MQKFWYKTSFLLSTLAISFFLAACTHPDPKKILKISYEKCKSIKNGYYEMVHYIKYMTDRDTGISYFNCYFKKMSQDTLYGFAFHYKFFQYKKYIRDVLYTGKAFVNYSVKDSTGDIMSTAKWSKDIKAYSHNYTFYDPVITEKHDPLPGEKELNDNKRIFMLVGNEKINNIPCYHIVMKVAPDKDAEEGMRFIRKQYDYWISQIDDIPIQYAIAYDIIIHNDTMHQYEKNQLVKYAFNKPPESGELSLSIIPPYVKLNEYKPYEIPKLIPNGSVAPDWTLISLKADTVKLSQLKGKLVLVDFFYKSCYPCMLALPVLERLHEKYHRKGLMVIGIDPFDSKEKDHLDEFLSKQGVSYMVLLNARKIADIYHVAVYPTVYIINQQGKIIFSQMGYGDEDEKRFEEIIKQHL